ncbi:PAS/PAC sensor signal transduction histidine kinase [unidentified eubacterium SCB49]|nr:PAS/PAC sensor signal transduction histidine kinase [unidentified eubacterium SCB49]
METPEKIIAILVYCIIFIVLLTTGLMLFFFYSRKKITKKELEKIELKLKNQREILHATITTQEEERKRIAQDLHDAISSKLNVISLTANLLLENDKMEKEDTVSLQHLLEINNSVLESSRKIAHDLLPPILEKFGLQVAIEELLDDYILVSKLQILYHIESIPNISSMDELHIFRIVQELINNALKHANATQLKIDLIKTTTGFELTFTDNGKGFNPSNKDFKSGLGIQNLKSRASILKCDLTIESNIPSGSSFNFKTRQTI